MSSSTIAIEQQDCYHCGDSCSGSPSVWVGDKAFCCEGCKLVYELLDDNELHTYYDLDSQPGITQKERSRREKFGYLENESVISRLADFQDDQQVHITLSIPNIHCTSCIWLLEKLYKLDGGVTQSTVNFLERELFISYHRSHTSLRSIAELLASIGYEPEIQLDRIERPKQDHSHRSLWLKLGVAGFAFGNIMLFSFPDYLSGTSYNVEGNFTFLFGFLSIALALPVLLYSSIDYLKSALAAVKQGGINLDVPISIGILALFLRSIYEITASIGPGYLDSFTGLIFFLLIGRLIQEKTFSRLSFDRDYRSYLPLSVTRIRDDDKEQTISVDILKKGDRVLIRNRELLPADAILMDGDCFVDYSFITGESEPIRKKKGDTIYAGGRIVGQSAKLDVIKEVSQSYLTELWNNAAFDADNDRTEITSLADRISPYFTISIIAVAFTAGIWWLSTGIETALNVFTAVLIIACPCALALSTPFTLGSALNIFARNGLYIKSMDLIEGLSKSTAIVFDKTGTLSRSEQAEVHFNGTKLTKEDRALIQSVCRQSIHPLSRKIADHLSETLLPEITSFNEKLNRGITADIGERKLVLGSLNFLQEVLSQTVSTGSGRPQKGSSVHIAIDGRYKGCFKVRSSWRSGLSTLLQSLNREFDTHLISGDNDQQKEQLLPLFGDESALHFNQKPQQKLDFITSLQERGETVLMIGDGLNDAGALKQSDFGIALSEDISSFSPACDAIMEANSLTELHRFINFSRSGIRIIIASFGLSLVYNVIGLGFAVTGMLSPLVAAILMPLSSVSIMLFTSITTHLKGKNMGLKAWK